MKLLNIFLILLLSPLLFGIINKVKAFFVGRKGLPVFQMYFDIIKLFRKGAVYSYSVSWIFALAPVISLASLIMCLLFLPLPIFGSPVSFKGDIILFVYLLALSRFVTVLAALDTGSSFEGMGAGREVFYSAIAEPAFFIALAVLVCKTADFSFSGVQACVLYSVWSGSSTAYMLVFSSLFIIMLSENCRVPFDDPNTHLELTMIHEVMILDYSGPDLGLILYASSLKLWIFASLIVLCVIPVPAVNGVLIFFLYFIEIALVVIIVGIVESVMARINFIKTPLLLLLATVLSLISLMSLLRAG